MCAVFSVISSSHMDHPSELVFFEHSLGSIFCALDDDARAQVVVFVWKDRGQGGVGTPELRRGLVPARAGA